MTTATQDIYALSPLQEGFLYHALADQGSAAYCIQKSYRLRGDLRADLVYTSLEYLFKRHDILRTAFVYEGLSRPFQVVLNTRKPAFQYEDIRPFSSTTQAAFLADFKQKDRKTSFHLSKDALLRVAVFQLGDGDFEFIWTHHHIIMDGWCSDSLIGEFNLIYTALCRQALPVLPPVASYRQFVKWLEKQDMERGLEHWHRQLEGYTQRAALPFPKNPILGSRYDPQEVGLVIPADTHKKIALLAAANNSTTNVFIQAVWGVLLSRYNNTQDVVFGTVVSIRPPEIQGIDSMIGLTINTIPLRVAYTADTTFLELLRQLKRQQGENERFQFCPLADIQQNSTLKANLIDHIIVFTVNQAKTQLEGISLAAEDEVTISNSTTIEQVNYDFSLHVSTADTLYIRFTYNGLAYESPAVVRVSQHFLHLIGSILAAPAQKIAALEILPAQEKQRLLHSGLPITDFPPLASCWTLFDEVVAQYPDNIAVRSGQTSLTYRQLKNSSLALAACLDAHKQAATGSVIGVLLDRSMESIVAMLAIWSAGATYLPFDVNQPNERLLYILENAGAEILLTTSDRAPAVAAFEGTVIFADDMPNTSRSDSPWQPPQPTPEVPAYLIYTSGTSGHPKGVPILHSGILDRLLYHIRHLGIRPDDRILHFAGIHFDASIVEIGMALLCGSTVVIAGAAEKSNVELLNGLLEAEKVSVAIFPPAYLKLLYPRPMASLRTIISTGEAATLQESLFYARQKAVFNGYGPTETCIGATFHQVNPALQHLYQVRGGIPIGQAFDHTLLYVLDSLERLVPLGAPGELCVAGPALSPGYWGQPELTSQRFKPNPFCSDPGYTRLYHTGDLVRMGETGELEFLGRIDEQIQIRGIRVEPGEVTYALCRCPGVKNAFVSAYSDEQGTASLLAYIEPSNGAADIKEWRRHLSSYLPDYMVPQHWMVVDRLPLSPNGKIDRQQLPPLTPEILLQHRAFAPPSTPDEIKMAAIWSELLGVKDIGLTDHFFEAGGHSLKATRMVAKVYKVFDRKIELSHVFRHPTIAELLPVVLAAPAAQKQGIQPAPPAPDYPASPAQQRTWILCQFDGAVNAYNITSAFVLTGKLQVAYLEKSIQALISRHESLRTTFSTAEGELRQVIQAFSPEWAKLERIDHRGLEKQNEALLDLLNRESALSFDLASGPLLRVRLVQETADRWVLYFTVHHIISDGWSMQVLFKELAQLYNAQCLGSQPSLKNLNIQYKDYTIWQQGQLLGENLTTHRQYWVEQLAEEIPVLDLPTDFQRPRLKTYAAARHTVVFDPAATAAIRKLASEQDLSLFVILMAGLKALLYRHTGQTDLMVGTLISGREWPELEDQIGFFANTLPLRTRFDPNVSLHEWMYKVRDTVMDAFKHQMFPFDYLVDLLSLPRDTSRSALFDVMLTHQFVGLFAETPQSLHGVKTTGIPAANTIANRYDLEFICTEYAEDMTCNILYNTDLFKPETIERMALHWRIILDAMVAQPKQTVAQIPLVDTTTEQLYLFPSWKQQSSWSSDQTAVSYIETQAARSPQQTAVICDTRTLSYAALNSAANRVANHLIHNCQVKPGEVVGLCLERSEWLIVGMLGILKAGCIYLPIDPQLPASRVDYLLQKAKVTHLLVQAPGVAPGVSLAQTELDEGLAWWLAAKDDNPLLDISPQDIAYLLFTSGSTGQPKGALIHHEALLNHLWSKVDLLELGPDTLVAQTASQSFDISIWQCLAPLVAGATVVVYPTMLVSDPAELIRSIDDDEINILQLVPSYLAELLEVLDHIRAEIGLKHLNTLILIGEALPPVLVERWFGHFPFIRLVNNYGPTEAADGVSQHLLLRPVAGASTPIGKPIDHMRIYVLDDAQHLCPLGVKGELYLSGTGVGQGYLDDPEKTNTAFLPDPFFPGRRMYKTGDMGRLLADGSYEHLGRRDNQIKVRGHRIELGEIEQLLYRLPAVKEAAVIVYQQDLCAYITLRNAALSTEMDIRSACARWLPPYMVPAHIVILPQMPLTASGKISRRQLPPPNAGIGASGRSIIAPQSEMEQVVLDIWRQVLEREDISTEDVFFNIGGHSFKAIRVQALLYKTLQIAVSVKDIFHHATIIHLARHLENLKSLHNPLEPIANSHPS